MTIYTNDFSAYTADAAPSDWTERWATADAASTVRSNSTSSGGKYLEQIKTTSSSYYLLSYDVIDADANRDLVEVAVLFESTAFSSSTDNQFCIALNGAGSSGSESGYILKVFDDGIVYFITKNAGGVATEGSFSASFVADKKYWLKFRVEKSGADAVLYGKYWADDDSEPVGWNGTETVTNGASLVIAGWVGVGGYSTPGTRKIDNIIIGTNGDSTSLSDAIDTTTVVRASSLDSQALFASDSPSVRASSLDTHVLATLADPVARLSSFRIQVLQPIIDPTVDRPSADGPDTRRNVWGYAAYPDFTDKPDSSAGPVDEIEFKNLPTAPIGVVIELEPNICTNVCGVAPCAAVFAVGGECYNTRTTCLDPNNYAESTKIYRYSDQPLGPEIGAIDCVSGMPSFNPTKIDSIRSLGERGRVSVTFSDFPHHDRDTDPYYATRLYNPMENGSYWGKFKARNKYIQNRILRVRLGYSKYPWDWNVWSSFEYLIEKIEGPDSGGNVTVIGRDMLSLIDIKKSQYPPQTNATLTYDIPIGGAASLIIEGDLTNYPTGGGYVVINDEAIKYTSRAANVLTAITRAQFNTVEADHSAGDEVQVCGVYENENFVDIFTDLLTRAGVDSQYFDTANYATEKARWWTLYNYTRCITKPTPIGKLITELVTQSIANTWWDDRTQKIKLKALAPTDAAVEIPLYTDDNDFELGKTEVTEQTDKRVSRVIIRYNKISPTAGDENKNYDTLINIDAESEQLYTEEKTLEIKAEWLGADNYNQVVALGKRLINKYKNDPKRIKFVLPDKLGAKWTGERIDVNTRKIQGSDGSSVTTRMDIISAKQDPKTGKITYIAETIGDITDFTGRYCYIMPNGSPTYSSATDEQKQTGGFICKDDGTFADGTEGYKIS